jgi:hypothetical protein
MKLSPLAAGADFSGQGREQLFVELASHEGRGEFCGIDAGCPGVSLKLRDLGK